MRASLVSNGQLLTPDPPDGAVPWWSVTKTVLCAAALSLVRDELIGLDDRVPEGPFTLRQLLGHRAGLADYGELTDYHAAVARGDAPWSADDMLHRLDASRLRYPPGTQWRYSNVGYLFVARLLERLTGVPLQQALERCVLAPLGLSRVRLATAPEDLRGEGWGAVTHYHPGWVYHGLLMGPLSEAALLLDRLLGGALLPYALVEEMQRALVLGGPIPGRPWTAPGYGLGLMIGAAQGGLTLRGHTGSGPGSVVAVYRCARDGQSATCAVFGEGEDQGTVETEALVNLARALDGKELD